MPEGSARHIFPGGNSYLGFYSYYANIITQENAARLIILKGGPGVGKSTFMKRLGEQTLKLGYDTEFLHCSSDCQSLDGVVIPALKTAVIDGTAPHVIDPKNPAAVDEILNFGEFWEEKGIRQHKKEIISLTREISAQFQRAYRYLHAAYKISADNEAIYQSCIDQGEVNKFSYEICRTLFCDEGIARKEGNTRSLFLSAITPSGLVHYIDDSIIGLTVYGIQCSLGLNPYNILQKIHQEASIRGYDTECFYCALDPEKLEHLIIPEKDCAFVTVNTYHKPHTEYKQWLDMNAFLNKAMLQEKEEDLLSNCILFDQLIERAVKMLDRAKMMHDKLETYYVPYINFDGVNACLDKTLKRILSVV